MKHSLQDKATALTLYVDDIVVTKDDLKDLSKKYLGKEFEIDDLGYLKYLMGIEVGRSKQEIFISQRKYVLDLLQKRLECKGTRACDTVTLLWTQIKRWVMMSSLYTCPVLVLISINSCMLLVNLTMMLFFGY